MVQVFAGSSTQGAAKAGAGSGNLAERGGCRGTFARKFLPWTFLAIWA